MKKSKKTPIELRSNSAGQSPMTLTIKIASQLERTRDLEYFSPSLYRLYNLDLRSLTDDEAKRHFLDNPHERRIFGDPGDTRSFLSMRWLRGNGLEIGAGGNPTPLFGNAVAVVGDCDADLAFGGKRLDVQVSVDSNEFRAIGKVYDFVVACHVLEHVDSFLRALENITLVTAKGGTIYIVLPDISWLHDNEWLPYFDFEHHIMEYSEPLKFSELHDEVYINAQSNDVGFSNVHAHISNTYQTAIRSGKIPQQLRFMHHKHNYTFEGWLHVMLKAQAFLNGSFKIVDVRFGHERLDCHFVLRVNS